jgi:hypothetical protein
MDFTLDKKNYKKIAETPSNNSKSGHEVKEGNSR